MEWKYVSIGIIGILLISVYFYYENQPISIEYISQDGVNVFSNCSIYKNGTNTVLYTNGMNGSQPLVSSVNSSYVFQYAFDSMVNGSTLNVYSGTYEFDTTITNLNINIIGNGRGSTRFIMIENLEPLLFIGSNTAQETNYITISNIMFDGNDKTGTLIRITSARYVTIEDCFLTDSTIDGDYDCVGLDIVANQTWIAWNHFNNVAMYALSTCANIRSLGNWEVNGQIFYDCVFIPHSSPYGGGIGCNISTGSSNTFTDCDFENGEYGIIQYSGYNQLGFKVNSARFEGNDYAFYIQTADIDYPTVIDIAFMYGETQTYYIDILADNGTFVYYGELIA